MNEVKISIIVPVYNVEKYLPKCLDSLINQTYKNLEIICVNDGSEDSSADILNRYAEQDNRFVIINKENEGVSLARNKALEAVSGEYIMFVDSDDWIDIYTCELAINKALQQKADVVFWTYIREFSNVSLQKNIFDESEIIFEQKEIEDKLYRRAFGLIGKELSHPGNADALCTIWGKLYKTSIVRDNKIYFYDIMEIGTYEDGLFNLNIWSFVNKAVYMNVGLYHYRKDNEQSVTTAYKQNLFIQWQRLFSVMNEIIKKNNLDSKFITALQNRICLSIIGLGLNILSGGKSIKKIKEIKRIIGCEQYRKAYKQLTLKYFPIHWKLFFFFAKHNMAFSVYIMLKCINMLKGR